ncbi:MAG: polysaccharide deacetylase family protein [Ruminococcaceae bacterium]|nr:polysaccharide deacetylase family protein [Oscillospiraceae bacterium]
MRRLILFGLVLAVLWGAGMPVGAEAEVIYRSAAKTEQLRVALTFDDGPHPKYTPQILKILKENNVAATFFAVGTNVEAYPALIKQIVEEGHELNNHTFNHNHVGKMSADALEKDIRTCNDTIQRISGVCPRYFRPPEGVCNCDVKEICGDLNMKIVMWSVDTRDWAHTPIEEICRNVKQNTQNGSIILMHDFIGKNSPTPEALRQIIPMLRELGFEFVTVSQLLGEGA